MGKIKDGFRKLTQPIPAKEIQSHYAAQLEVELAMIRAQQALAAVVVPAKQAFSNLCEQYDVKQDDWNFDLKAGTMTRKPVEVKGEAS